MALTRRIILSLGISFALLLGLAHPLPAHADPTCQDRGVYVLFARGSTAEFNSLPATTFRSLTNTTLRRVGIGNVGWAELGNLDNHTTNENKPDRADEYPARGILSDYSGSVEIGVNELVKHLNQRYGNGPGDRNCANETAVLGGYSQGAQVVAHALLRTGYGALNQSARSHIGYVAMYGDPDYNPGSLSDRLAGRAPWWIRGSGYGYRFSLGIPIANAGIFGGRNPYVPADLRNRLGSWCDEGDGYCNGTITNQGNHGSIYHTLWMPDSMAELAARTITKRNHLNPTQPPLAIPAYTVTRGPTAQYETGTNNLPQPVVPRILQVKRTTDPNGTPQVYAATKSAITEAYWIPGGDGIHLHEIIHIAQGDIVSFDKVNLPEGKQAVYTAVSDGVWESWWQPGSGVHSAKIISGLTGVRQVIVDNRWENGQYVHRLYILAADGPYEAWWKDGGDGIHLTRLNNITGPVTMAKGANSAGEDQLYVATPTWVYKLWWGGDGTVHYKPMLNITQADIRGLSIGDNLPDGAQLLYTGTSTTAWQSYWRGNSNPDTGTIATSQTNALQIKKTVYNGIHQLYLATPDHVQEYWWNGPQSGGGEIFRRPQHDIASFDKSNDGADQQVYTGTATGEVWETWWRGGNDPVRPTSKVLFGVVR